MSHDPTALSLAARWLRSAREVVVFTGAGVSTESGIPTFCDETGFWRQFPVVALATWKIDPSEGQGDVWLQGTAATVLPQLVEAAFGRRVPLLACPAVLLLLGNTAGQTSSGTREDWPAICLAPANMVHCRELHAWPSVPTRLTDPPTDEEMEMYNRLFKCAVVIWTAPLCFALTAMPAAGKETIDFSGAPIVTGDSPAALETLAARELQRYLRHACGKVSPICTTVPATGQCILLGTPRSHAGIAALAQSGAIRVSEETLGEEGFVIKVLPQAQPRLVLAAATPRAVLWSVYAFLERLGFGFYLGGDAFADVAPPRLADDLDIISKPAFAVRGSLPWYCFLNGPTTWDRDDYRYFFDQMAKMRMNFVGFKSYDDEPFCAYPWKGKLVGGEPLVTAENYNRARCRG